MSNLQQVVADLTLEAEEVDRMVADLEPARWELPTPAPNWTVRDQIAHLAFIFRLAGTAASDADAFQQLTASAGDDFDRAINTALQLYVGHSPRELLASWRDERDASIKALASARPGSLLPWLVRPIPPAVLGSAGIMELFAHGQDIADTLGIHRKPTSRLRHLVEFAVLTRDFGYQSRGIDPPDAEFRFEITGPAGEEWNFGPLDAPNRISGPAQDFCLLVTRRRHPEDLTVRATGAEAVKWLEIAQAYRGPAGHGRKPGQFAALG